MPAMIEADLTTGFRRAMRRLAATVTIISTADRRGTRHGMTATAVSSVSADPPSLLVCVNTAASPHDPLLTRGRFCVNVLTTGHEALVSAFAGYLAGEDRFAVGDWREDDDGVPYLHGAQCNVFCTVDTVVPFGSHSVVIGRVDAVRVADAVAPLIYADGTLWSAQPLGAARLPED
jgi:flavin reductase (DIM6/NTAB) family NADH-FMN oxidoreductase RutF